MKHQELTSGLSKIAHDHEESIDKNYFNNNYGYRGIPVVFKKAFQENKMKKHFSKEELLEKFTSIELIEDCQSEDKLFMTLAEFFEDKREGLYFKATQKFDTEPLDIFDCWYANTKVSPPKNKLSWIYAGKPDSFSDIHVDIWHTSAWNYLVKGTKLWLVYPIDQNVRIKENISKYKINSLLHPNDTLNTNVKPLFAVQEEGDMLYIPSGYYHCVINLDETIAVTGNFMNETNYEHVRSFFKNGENAKNYENIEQIIKEGFQQLK